MKSEKFYDMEIERLRNKEKVLKKKEEYEKLKEEIEPSPFKKLFKNFDRGY